MISNTLRDIARMVEVAVEGLTALHGATNLGGDKAGPALAAVGAGISSLLDGFTGKTSPDVVAADMKALIEKIATEQATLDTSLDENNKAVDAEVDKKFPTGGEP